MYMATLATDDNTRMGKEGLFRVETPWGRPFQQVREGINHFYVTNRIVAEAEAFEEESIGRFNADLMRLGEEVRMVAVRLKRRGTTRPTAKEAGQLPEPTVKGTATWLELAMLHIKG